MNKRFDNVSMNGRMAYVIMCVESFLCTEHPDKQWNFIAKRMWDATSMNWGDWPDEYSVVIPDVLLQYDVYDADEFNGVLTENEYNALKEVYTGITDGIEDDPTDEVNYMLNKPFEMAMVYEGTVIGDGHESIEIINETETILKKHGIPLPDYSKVLFSSITEKNGWGNDFDGRFLSVILDK